MNASEYGYDALIVLSDKDPIYIPLPVTKKEVKWLSSRLSALRKTEFSLLPLHAASPYRPRQKGFSDLYVSSYTMTLTVLTRAQRAGSPDSAHEEPRFVTIGQPGTKVTSKLLSVGTELDKIGQLVDGLATFMRIEGEDSRISTVAEELGKNDWAYFTCHGVPKQETPFESGFALHDGEFTVEHISKCDFRNPEFAYLSACYTTVGDKESPDEVIHLATAMQFGGLLSVLGTMWAVDDLYTNKVISKFYELMVNDSGRLDYTCSAGVASYDEEGGYVDGSAYSVYSSRGLTLSGSWCCVLSEQATRTMASLRPPSVLAGG